MKLLISPMEKMIGHNIVISIRRKNTL